MYPMIPCENKQLCVGDQKEHLVMWKQCNIQYVDDKELKDASEAVYSFLASDPGFSPKHYQVCGNSILY